LSRHAAEEKSGNGFWQASQEQREGGAPDVMQGVAGTFGKDCQSLTAKVADRNSITKLNAGETPTSDGGSPDR